MGAKDGTKPLKRGSPEHLAHMRALGAKGGRATRDKHPGHLAEIAAIGGRATRNTKKITAAEHTAPRTPMAVTGKANAQAIEFLDSIIEELDG
jgi:hypothetical protein